MKPEKERKKKKKKDNEKLMESRMWKLYYVNLQRNAYTEVASCKRRPELSFYVTVKKQVIRHILQNNHTTKHIKESEHPDQP